MWDSAGPGAVLVQEVKVTKGLCRRPGKIKKASISVDKTRYLEKEKTSRLQPTGRVADPYHFNVDAILLLIRMMQNCDHWSTYKPFRAPFLPPRIHYDTVVHKPPNGSILNL